MAKFSPNEPDAEGKALSTAFCIASSLSLSLNLFLIVFPSYVLSLFPYCFLMALVLLPFSDSLSASFVFSLTPLSSSLSFFLLSDRGWWTGGKKGRRRRNRVSDYIKANIIGGEKPEKVMCTSRREGRERERGMWREP